MSPTTLPDAHPRHAPRVRPCLHCANIGSRMLVPALLLLAAAGPAVPIEPAREAAPACIDRSRYPGSEELSDDELGVFVEVYGDLFPPFSRIPEWAIERVELLAARRHVVGAKVFERPGADLAGGANVNVSAEAADYAEAFVAVDHSDPRRLVASAITFSGRGADRNYWSGDGGLTWSGTPMPMGMALTQWDPGAAWDGLGNAYVCAMGGLASGPAEVQVAGSSDGGRTWSGPVALHDADGDDKTLVAADATPGSRCANHVCVAWFENIDTAPPRTGRIHVSCAPGLGGPWVHREVTSGRALCPAPAFGPDGELYLAWFAGTRIDVARSDDCGDSFGVARPVAPVRADLNLAIPAMCHAYKGVVLPAIDVDRSTGPRRGWVYVVWADAAPGADCSAIDLCDPCTTDVYFARSADGGLTWSPPVTVHTDAPGVDQINPGLAVDDASGAVDVVWFDTRNDPSRMAVDLYMRRTADGGGTWGAEVRVSSEMSNQRWDPLLRPRLSWADLGGAELGGRVDVEVAGRVEREALGETDQARRSPRQCV